MDKMVDDRVQQCQKSLIANSDGHPAPVATEEVVESSWSNVSLDFGSFPDGRVMMVLMDNYTKYQ